MAEHLFEDVFNVTRMDPDGKKFDRVNRIEAKSEQLDMYMQLDVDTDVYPMHVGDKFTMVLAPTLNLDGTQDTGFYTQAGRKTLADKYDYQTMSCMESFTRFQTTTVIKDLPKSDEEFALKRGSGAAMRNGVERGARASGAGAGRGRALHVAAKAPFPFTARRGREASRVTEAQSSLLTLTPRSSHADPGFN